MTSHPIRNFMMTVDGLAAGTVTGLIGLGIGAADHHVALTGAILALAGAGAGAGGTYVVANKINRGGRAVLSAIEEAASKVEAENAAKAPATAETPAAPAAAQGVE